MFLIILSLLLTIFRPAQASAVQLKVAVVQFRSSSELEDNSKRMVAILERLAGQRVQVAVFPECALTGYQKDAMSAGTEEVESAEEPCSAKTPSQLISLDFGVPQLHAPGMKILLGIVVVQFLTLVVLAWFNRVAWNQILALRQSSWLCASASRRSRCRETGAGCSGLCSQWSGKIGNRS